MVEPISLVLGIIIGASLQGVVIGINNGLRLRAQSKRLAAGERRKP